MAALDLFASRGIPPEIADFIFLLAGPKALTSVRCTSRVNADAYEGTALGLARRGLWRCRVGSVAGLQFAETNKLPCLRVEPYSHSLMSVASFGWLRELSLSGGSGSYSRAIGPPAITSFPPALVSLRCAHLGFDDLPLLPDTLTHLHWYEGNASSTQKRFTGPLPSSLKGLLLNILSCAFDLPALPPSLEKLELDSTRVRGGVLPTLPASLKRLGCVGCDLTELPDLPDSLVVLHCAMNHLLVLPALPASLKVFDCSENQLQSLPALPLGLEKLAYFRNKIVSLPAPLPPGLDLDYNEMLLSIIHASETDFSDYDEFSE